MRYTGAALALFTLTIQVSAAAASADTAGVRPLARDDDDHKIVRVDCSKGQTVGAALARGQGDTRPLVIRFVGTCQENTLINRDDVELYGVGSGSLLIGHMDVKSSSRVNLHDFRVQGIPGEPFDTLKGGINIIEGSSATVQNVQVSNTKVRGIQVDHSAAVLGAVAVDGGQAGAFVFRAAQILFNGNVSATNSLFGMSLLYSASTAKFVDFNFDHDVFALLIQASSTFEHVAGHLVVTNSSALGIGVFGQGVFPYGSFIEAHNNQNIAFQVDELSSFSPLIGAPGGGPSLTVTDNPGVGISVERGSTFEFATLATVEHNSVGLQVDGSYLRMANATITHNTTADVKLTFGSKAEFNGANVVGTPVQCDSTVLTRGTFGCGGH